MFDLTKIKKVHFIGVGGIGISAIARMMLLLGKEVSGSDQSQSQITEELALAGAEIFLGHNAHNLPIDADLVVYTIAIPEANPELSKAHELSLPLMSYPEFIGALSEEKRTIAVTGTHGKTTTTAMIAEVMLASGLDPTVVVGSILKNHKSNFVAGTGEFLVVEACEYRRSFLNLQPEVLVITNIEEDHLDYYEDLTDIQSAFRELVSRVPETGAIICNPNDEKVKMVLVGAKAKIIDYTQFDLSSVNLKVPGEFNKSNARAALSAVGAVGVNGSATSAIEGFSGTWRRFDYQGKTETGALVYDDYAHHPTEIRETLKMAQGLAGEKKVIVAFQPHLFSRTKLLLKDLIDALAVADQIFVLPIYAAREVDDGSVSSELLAEGLKSVGAEAYFESDFSVVAKKIESQAGLGDIVITMGAGDIFKLPLKVS